jgi:hypothetical protein
VTISSLRSRASAIQAAEFLRHAYGGADFQPGTGQVVQHADFLHHAGWMVVGQYDSHDAKAQSIRSRAERGNQQVGRGGVRAAETVLAKKYAFKA